MNNWLRRTSLIPGVPLVQNEQITLPPLQLRLGLMENCMKVMDKRVKALNTLRQYFPESPHRCKIEWKNIWRTTNMGELMKNTTLNMKLNETERRALRKFYSGKQIFIFSQKSWCRIFWAWWKISLDIETRHNWKWSERILAIFCWSIRRDTSIDNMKTKKLLKYLGLF